MSKKGSKNHNLPQLQKRILLCLAEKGPQTRNEVKKDVKSAYKNILYSFKSLEKKGLIQKVGHKSYRKQRFPQFWLTFEGIILSVLEGASPDSLLEHAKDCLPKDTDTDRVLATIESTRDLDRRLLQHMYSLLRRKKELEPVDVILLTIQAGMIQGITFDEGIEQIKVIMNAFKKYPRLNEELMAAWKDMDKVIQEIKKGVKP